MKYRKTIVVSAALLLSLSALVGNFVNTFVRNDFDIFYLCFTFIGIFGTIAAILEMNYGRFILMLFFGLQTIYIYGDSFRFVFNPGFSISFNFFSGQPSQIFQNPRGFSLNILGLLLFFLSYFWLKEKKEKIPN